MMDEGLIKPDVASLRRTLLQQIRAVASDLDPKEISDLISYAHFLRTKTCSHKRKS